MQLQSASLGMRIAAFDESRVESRVEEFSEITVSY
jgi:hypothetical protein